MMEARDRFDWLGSRGLRASGGVCIVQNESYGMMKNFPDVRAFESDRTTLYPTQSIGADIYLAAQLARTLSV